MGKTCEGKHCVYVTKGSKIVASSRNLDIITRYNREKSSIKKMRIGKLSHGRGLVLVDFEDGAVSSSEFEDYTVLEYWAEKKQRRFGFELVKE